MIKKHHNHTLQTNPRDGEEDPQNKIRKAIIRFYHTIIVDC